MQTRKIFILTLLTLSSMGTVIDVCANLKDILPWYSSNPENMIRVKNPLGITSSVSINVDISSASKVAVSCNKITYILSAGNSFTCISKEDVIWSSNSYASSFGTYSVLLAK